MSHLSIRLGRTAFIWAACEDNLDIVEVIDTTTRNLDAKDQCGNVRF